MGYSTREKRKIAPAEISKHLGNSSFLLGAQTKSESEVVPHPLDLPEEEPSAGACSNPARGVLGHLGQFNQR